MTIKTFFSFLLDILLPPRPSERRIREATVADVARHLSSTFFETDTKEQITFLLPYHEESVRDCVLEAKYHSNTKATALLGEVLGDFLLDYSEEETALESHHFVLVPVPLSQKRKKARGYNQSEEICRSGLRPDLPFDLAPELLTRTRDTSAQTKLSGNERRKNMKDAFLAQGINSTYTYIIVDDVVTTGTTLLSAMRALKKAGAKNVSGLALAH